MDFGVVLRKLRTDAGLTQEQLALRIGLTKSVVSYYEKHERMPSPEIVVKIADIFHVTTDYLLGVKKEKTIDLTGLSEDDEKLVYLLVESLRNKNG